MHVHQTIDLVASLRKYTPAGYLVAPARIARTGIQQYLAAELGITDGDPSRRVNVMRPESEVFDAAAMSSFEGVPLTIDHPAQFVSARNWKALAVGAMQRVRRDGEFLVGDVTVTDHEAIALIEAGKVQLSAGYEAFYDAAGGQTTDGEPYEFVQRAIRANHVALVDAARCGPVCRIADTTLKGASMKRITVDGIPFEADEPLAAAIEKLQASLDAQARTIADHKPPVVAALGRELSTEDAARLIADQATQIDALKRDVVTPDQRDTMVRVWAELLDSARRLVPGIATDGKTCDAIRREVVKALHRDHGRVIDTVLAGKTVDQADQEQLKTVYAVLAEVAKPAQDAAPPAADPLRVLASQPPARVGDAADADDPREAYMRRLANVFVPQTAS